MGAVIEPEEIAPEHRYFSAEVLQELRRRRAAMYANPEATLPLEQVLEELGIDVGEIRSASDAAMAELSPAVRCDQRKDRQSRRN